MIRISQIHEGSKQHLLVEGTLSGEWVEVLEDWWLERPHAPNGEPIGIDLSGVTHIDDKGRELVARLIKGGAEVRATGIMIMAVIEEIMEMVAMARDVLRRDGTWPSLLAPPRRIERRRE